MTRLGSYYRYEYNEKNLLIREYTISGKDKIDTLCYHYDNYDNLDLETRMYNDYENEDQHKKIYDTIRYNNVYDSQNRLI